MEINETTVTKKPTIANLIPGNVYVAGYKRGERNFTDLNRFTGFKVGSLTFTNLKQLKQYFGVRNLRDLEFQTDSQQLGSVTAEFFNCEEGYHWAAYLYNGGFKVGTSADALKLAAAA
jgi:hypothetical protein